MRAIVSSLLDPSKRQNIIKLDTSRPLPETSDNLLCIQVLASPIDVSDVLNANGDFPMTSFPRVPGRNFAGVVTGPVHHPLFQKLVYGTSGSQFSFTRDGAHAEYISVAPEGVAEVPAGVGWKAASIMGTPWTTAYLSLLQAKSQKGETVLILGAGGAVGDAAVQLARSSLFGCQVLRGGRGEKYEVNTDRHPNMEVVNNLTGGKGVDIVVDTTGDCALMKAALGIMALGGRMTVISVGPDSTIDIDLKALYRNEHCIIGCNSVAHSQEVMASWLRVMNPLLESGELKAPDASHYTEVSLGEAANVYVDFMTRSQKKYLIVNK